MITTTVGGAPGLVGVCVTTEVMTFGVTGVEGGTCVDGGTVDTGVVETTAEVTAALELGGGGVKVEIDVAVEKTVEGGRVVAGGGEKDGVVTTAANRLCLAYETGLDEEKLFTSAVRHSLATCCRVQGNELQKAELVVRDPDNEYVGFGREEDW